MTKKIIAKVTGTALAGMVALSTFAMPAFAAGPITPQQAQQIAYSTAGVAANNVSFSNVKKDYENGKMVYEVEFHVGMTEYNYDVDIATGTIVDWDIDIDD